MISVSAWEEKDGTWVATWYTRGNVVLFSPFPEDADPKKVVRASSREDAYRKGQAAAYREIASDLNARAAAIESTIGAGEMCFACCPYHSKSTPCRRSGT